MTIVSAITAGQDYLSGIYLILTGEAYIVPARRQMIVCQEITIEGTGTLTIEGILCLN